MLNAPDIPIRMKSTNSGIKLTILSPNIIIKLEPIAVEMYIILKDVFIPF